MLRKDRLLEKAAAGLSSPKAVTTLGDWNYSGMMKEKLAEIENVCGSLKLYHSLSGR